MRTDWRQALFRFTPSRHLVLLYEEDHVLRQASSAWVSGSLVRGGGALVLARPAQRAELLRELAATGIDVDVHQRSGRLVLLDAETTLDAMVVDGRVGAQAFQATVVERARAIRAACTDKHHAEFRIWGEMINVLHARGAVDTAADIERHLRAFLQSESAQLLWGYGAAEWRGTTDPLPAHDLLDARSRRMVGAAMRSFFELPAGASAIGDAETYLLARGALPIGEPPTRAWLLPVDANTKP